MIRVLIVDDEEIVRKALRMLLELEPDIQVVGEAANGQEALAFLRAEQPDVTVLDIMLPVLSGLEVLEAVQREGLQTRILVLTARSDQELAMNVIKAGATGYLLKTVAVNALAKAVREVYRGESALDPQIARKVIVALQRPPTSLPNGIPLTPQELHILAWVAYGLSNREIAGKLYLSEHTVRTHVGTILEKLNLATRTQAALYAIREKLVRLDQIPVG